MTYPLSRLTQTEPNTFSIYLTEQLFGDPATGYAVVETLVGFIKVEAVGPDASPRLRLYLNKRFEDAGVGFAFDDEGEVTDLYLNVLRRIQAVAEGRALLAEAPKLLDSKGETVSTGG